MTCTLNFSQLTETAFQKTQFKQLGMMIALMVLFTLTKLVDFVAVLLYFAPFFFFFFRIICFGKKLYINTFVYHDHWVRLKPDGIFMLYQPWLHIFFGDTLNC